MSIQNPIIRDGVVYTGLYYAVSGTGGYKIEQGIRDVSMIVTNIVQYDVTNSIQVLFDVRTFNIKLGLYKDASNVTINSTTYNNTAGAFPTDSLSLTATEFMNGITNNNQILSVGKYSSLYSDYNSFLTSYFSYSQGFSSLFNLSTSTSTNAGVFDASAFIYIIKNHTLNPSTGEYVKDLSGTVTINSINSILKFICKDNPFNNRDTAVNTIRDGFKEGDIIFIPGGLSATLNLKIYNNNVNLNTLGNSYVSGLVSSTNYSNGYFSNTTTATEQLMTKVTNAPLLIKLANLSTAPTSAT